MSNIKTSSRYPILATMLVFNFFLIAGAVLGGGAILVNYIGTTITAHNQQEEQLETIAKDETAANTLANETFPPLQIGTGNYTAEETTDNLTGLLSGTSVGYYWQFRTAVAQNVEKYSEMIGTDVTISSPNEMGSDTQFVVTDGETTCNVDMIERTLHCE